MALRGWTLALRAAVVAAAFAVAGVGAPSAYAGNGQCVAKVHVEDAGFNNVVGFDGTYLYYSTFGPDVLGRVLPPGTPAGSDPTGCPTYTAGPGDVAAIVGLAGAGIQVLTFDAVDTDIVGKPVFWAVGESGRDVYKLVWEDNPDPTPDVVLATPQFVIPDAELPDGCKTALVACAFEVDGLAYDAVSKLLWYSPDGTKRVYAFEPVPVIPALAGYFDTDTPDPMAPDCPSNVDSGIAIGGPATSSSGSDEAIAYLTSNECTNWFRYKIDAEATPNKQQVYSTFTPGIDAEDDECDSDTFNTPVVWVRDGAGSDDGGVYQFQAYAVSTCTTGGGVKIANSPRMTGGGGIPVVDPGTNLPTGQDAHHGFTIHCNGYDQPNELQVSTNTDIFHLRQLDAGSISCDVPKDPFSGNVISATIKGKGLGRWDEHKCRKPDYDCARVEFTFTDLGEPGTLDNGDIKIYYPATGGPPVFHAAGALVTGSAPGEGNYQYHAGKSG